MNFSNIKWLDDRGHVKPPLFLYLILIYLARGWCVWIASLTQFSDRAALVTLFYPQKVDFLMSLAAGFGAVLIYMLVIAERKRSPAWLQPLFKYAWGMLFVLLCVDGALLIQKAIHSHYEYSWSLGLDALFMFWSLLYIFQAKHLSLYFNDWQPDADEEESLVESTNPREVDSLDAADQPSVADSTSEELKLNKTSAIQDAGINSSSAENRDLIKDSDVEKDKAK